MNQVPPSTLGESYYILAPKEGILTRRQNSSFVLGDFAVTFRPFFPVASAGSFINYDRDSPSLRTVFRFNGCDIEHRGLKSEHMVI
jgi:hypothetical protein